MDLHGPGGQYSVERETIERESADQTKECVARQRVTANAIPDAGTGGEK